METITAERIAASTGKPGNQADAISSQIHWPTQTTTTSAKTAVFRGKFTIPQIKVRPQTTAARIPISHPTANLG